MQTKKTCPYVARGEGCRCGSINVHNGIGQTLLSGPPGLVHGVGASYREGMMISTDDGPACFKDLRGKIKCRFFTVFDVNIHGTGAMPRSRLRG